MYRVAIDGVEMTAISLVEDPAIESNFQAFDRVHQMFAVQDEERRMVMGPVIRCEYPILRQFADGSYYQLVFSKDVAQKMISDYLLNNHAGDVNLGHTSYYPDGVEPVSYFIKDSVRGIAPKGFEDIVDGSVFAVFHIVNDDVWTAVKDGTFKGFSLECYMDVEPVKDTNGDWLDAVLSGLGVK